MRDQRVKMVSVGYRFKDFGWEGKGIRGCQLKRIASLRMFIILFKVGEP